MGKLAQQRPTKIEEEKGILKPSQFGLPSKLSANLVENVRIASEPRRNRVIVALLDIQKAYERVWREGVLYMLDIDDFPLWTRTRFLLTGRPFCVRVGSVESS